MFLDPVELTVNTVTLEVLYPACWLHHIVFTVSLYQVFALEKLSKIDCLALGKRLHLLKNSQMKEKCGHFGWSWRWEKGTELLSQWFVNGEGSFSTW